MKIIKIHLNSIEFIYYFQVRYFEGHKQDPLKDPSTSVLFFKRFIKRLNL